MFSKLKNEVLPKAEKMTSNAKLKSYFHAILQWIYAEEIYSVEFSKITNYNLDYLLQMAIVSDKV